MERLINGSCSEHMQLFALVPCLWAIVTFSPLVLPSYSNLFLYNSLVNSSIFIQEDNGENQDFSERHQILYSNLKLTWHNELVPLPDIPSWEHKTQLELIFCTEYILSNFLF